MKILTLTLIAGFLRFYALGEHAFWIDEVIFANMVRDVAYQEYPTVWLAQVLNLQGEFWLRAPFALAGTLTVPAVYWVTRNLWASGITAVLPLFVFWSRMARPYAFIGLMVVIGWRFWPAYLIGIATSPLALIGVKWSERWWVIVLCVVSAFLVFNARPDVDRGWSISMLQYHTRFFYVPALAVILHWFDRFEHRVSQPRTKP